jgi:hypothetical protein
MKAILNRILVVAVLALSALATFQLIKLKRLSAQLSQCEARLAVAEKSKSEADSKLVAAARREQILDDVLRNFSTVAAQRGEQVAQLKNSLAATKDTRAGLFGGLLSDPEMKQAMESQQRTALALTIPRQYGEFIRQIKLNAEQAANLKDLLAKKQIASVESAMAMADAAAGGQGADWVQTTAAEKDEYDASIQQLLGDHDYRALQDYEKTIPDRTEVEQFRQDLSGQSAALSTEQEQQLIRAMSEQRIALPPTDYSRGPNGTGQLEQNQRLYEERLFARTRRILSPEQQTIFEQFQKKTADVRLSAEKLAAKMASDPTPAP